jgi:hypothetical protein
MKFKVTHSRAFIGSDINVEIVADGNETIRSVNISLDGSTLDESDLDVGTSQYQREFRGVGDVNTGMDHTLVAAAMDQDLNPHSSQTRWTDI